MSIATMPSPAYPALSRVLRDPELEAELQIGLRAPSSASAQAVRSRLESAWSRIGASFDMGERFRLFWERPVLTEPLSATQRATLDARLLPRYSAAIEEDEAPRERLPLKECGERMVSLVEVLQQHEAPFSLTQVPYHAACGDFAGKPRILCCREEAARLFARFALACESAQVLPHIEDVFRPPQVQGGLYLRRYRMIRDEFPHWSEEQVRQETRAKTAASPFRAAHMGGAAIDLTLRDSGGNPLPLGNAYPVGGAVAVLHSPYVTERELETRALFALLAESVGLVPYPGEDWHVSIGDGLAALITGERCIRYGPLEDFDRATGAIVPFPSGSMYQEFPVS